MQTLARISAAAALFATFAVPAWAGPVGVTRTTEVYQTTTTTVRPNPQLIADLEQASQDALREGRNGNKNNPYFAQKSWQIDNVIDQLESGQQVSMAEIDQALAKPDLY